MLVEFRGLRQRGRKYEILLGAHFENQTLERIKCLKAKSAPSTPFSPSSSTKLSTETCEDLDWQQRRRTRAGEVGVANDAVGGPAASHRATTRGCDTAGLGRAFTGRA